MNSTQAWCIAVIGGVIGAVLMMVVSLFSPLKAQNQSDANFGKITCTELEVVHPDGTMAVFIFHDALGGSVRVWSKDEKVSASMNANVLGASIGVWTKNTQEGGNIFVDHVSGDGGVRVFGENWKGKAAMSVSEHGGFVTVHDKDGQVKTLD